MNHAITIELQFFLISILWGAMVLLGYDVLRIIRRLIKHNGFFMAVEDLLFWVITSVFIFAMIYRENNGIIRGFSVMGMAIGMVLYHYILSDMIVSLITKFIFTLLRPLRFVLKKIKQFIRFLTTRGRKLASFIFIRLKKLHKSVRIALNSRRQKRNEKKKKRRDKKALKKDKKAEKKQKTVPNKKEGRNKKAVPNKNKKNRKQNMVKNEKPQPGTNIKQNFEENRKRAKLEKL